MKSIKIKTQSPNETFLLGQLLAKEILKWKPQHKPIIIGLIGELGSGKTVFVQGFSKGLNIKNKITSPTFLILRRYKIKNNKYFKNFYHIDAYRIKSKNDLENTGIKKALSDKGGILVIEWADLIKKEIPYFTLVIKFKHLVKNKRALTFKQYERKTISH